VLKHSVRCRLWQYQPGYHLP